LRGFTLVELMVVVLIIAVLAVIAVPSVARRMQDRRTLQAAHEVSNMYRTARMRAMGRGSAVLVRYNGGTLEMREAVRGTGEADVNCQRLPISSCLTPNWGEAAEYQVVDSFNPETRTGMQNVEIELGTPGGDQTQMDVCFTPMGRAYVRYDFTSTLTTLAAVPEARIWREDDDGAVLGLMRSVLILPNGNARLGTARPKT
jgi:type IV fimbrial biogenesis protein FimT